MTRPGNRQNWLGSGLGSSSHMALVCLLAAKYGGLKPSCNNWCGFLALRQRQVFRDVELTKLKTWSGHSRNRLGKLDVCQAACCNFWEDVPWLLFWMNGVLGHWRDNMNKGTDHFKTSPFIPAGSMGARISSPHNNHHYQWGSEIPWDPPPCPLTVWEPSRT